MGIIYTARIECEKTIQLSVVINLTTTVRPRCRAVINEYCDGDNNNSYPIIILNKDSDNDIIYYKLLYAVYTRAYHIPTHIPINKYYILYYVGIGSVSCAMRKPFGFGIARGRRPIAVCR